MLRNSEKSIVDYLGMVVAIDFRHWAEVPVPEGAPLAAVGEEVTFLTGFYTAVATVANGEELSFQQAAEESALHRENDKHSLLRGSAAMIYLLRRAVEEHGILWYSPDFLTRFHSVAEAKEALAVCFRGCHEDGVTPMWMPATEERVELLLSLGKCLLAQRTSFYELLVASQGQLYTELGDKGFIQRLTRLHPRFQDFAPHPFTTGVWLPILKLAQLTAIAIEEALPAYWQWCRHHPRESGVSERDTNRWLVDCASRHGATVFADLEAMSVCCDYQIPKALRDAGVLQYDAHLTDLVDRGVLLQPGGAEETSIRLGTLVAVEMLLEYVTDILRQENDIDRGILGDKAPIVALDYALWYVGRYPEGVSSRHHLCRTIMY